MKKIILTYIVFFNMAIFATDVTKSSQAFVSICIQDSAVGYSWENKKWVQKNFTSSKEIIKKIINDKYCKNENIHKQLTKSIDKEMYVQSCYEIDKMKVRNCYETWIRTSKNTAFLKHVSCDTGYGKEVSFELEGNFIETSTSPRFFNVPGGDYHDSIYIAHGTCTTITVN